MKNEKATPTIEELMAQIEGLSKQVDVLATDNESLAKENRQLASVLTDAKAAQDAKIDSLKAGFDETVSKLKADYDKQIGVYKAELDKLIEQIKLINMRFYGSKSEKVIPEQIGIFNDVEFSADCTAEPPVEEIVKPRRRGGKRVIDLDAFEHVIIEHTLPAEERLCPVCDSPLEEMKVEVTQTVRMVPAHLIVEEHHRHVYICKTCSDKNSQDGSVSAQIVRAPMPNAPIPRSFATPSMLAYIINAKYTNALPLYRLEEDFKTLGAPGISRQNMANWIINVHDRWLSLLYARMKDKLLEGDIIHCDETPIQVLKEPGRKAKQKSYVWLFRSPACTVANCIYEYHPTRSGSVPTRFFDGWSGTIMTDGYDPYFKLGPKITNTACLVHVRRKFAEIVKVAGGDVKARSVESVALEARIRIDALFAIDSKFDDMDPDKRCIARLKELAPRMQEFDTWARQQILLAVPKMALSTALAYAIKMWPYVTNVLNDGRLELSNNIAERAIKPFVIGRKNWLFSDTPKGADASCAIYSIVVSAKLNGLNPRAYLEWLLTEMPNASDLTDTAVMDRFLPWSKAVPTDCRLSTRQAAKAAQMSDDPIVDIDPAVFEDREEES